MIRLAIRWLKARGFSEAGAKAVLVTAAVLFIPVYLALYAAGSWLQFESGRLVSEGFK